MAENEMGHRRKYKEETKGGQRGGVLMQGQEVAGIWLNGGMVHMQ